MKTVHEHIRHRLIGHIDELSQPKKPPPEKLRESEWSDTFERLMRNRLVMGAFRYELFKQKNDRVYDHISSILKRIHSYQKTGNTEYLVDCANLLMLEFIFGKHPTKHFKSIDDGQHVNLK